MTNFEKYKDEILEIIEYNTIAVDTKKTSLKAVMRRVVHNVYDIAIAMAVAVF